MDKLENSTDKIENGLADVASGVGHGRQIAQAQTTENGLTGEIRTLNRSFLTYLYMQNGIIQTLVDQPVHDGFAKGIEFQDDDLNPDDVKELQAFMNEQGVFKSFKQALIYARLFGGSGLIINIDDQDPETPLDLETITEESEIEFYAADRWELNYKQAKQGASMVDQFHTNQDEVPYNYYGQMIHKSRVIRFMGKEAPSLIRGALSGWGLSVCEKIIKSFNMYEKNQAVLFEMLDEAKLDIIKIQGFNKALMTSNGVEKTVQHLQAANTIKNYQNALVMDKEDEWEQRQMALSGVADVQKENRVGIAADVRMPLTKLFGISSSGFNAGEDDLENYNAMVEADVQSQSKTGLAMVIQILSKKLFDLIPEGLSIDFPPMRMLKETEESVLKIDEINRINSAISAGWMSQEKAQEEAAAKEIFKVKLSEEDITPFDELAADEDAPNIGIPDTKQTSTTGRG